jgi:glucose/arabinose dehydrogenase
MKTTLITSLLFVFILNSTLSQTKSAYNPPERAKDPEIQLEKIDLPKGFKIEVFAENIDDARSMEVGKDGIIFVGNRRGDKVYAVVDEDNDYKADKKYVIVEGLNMPNGIALKGDDLYVAEVNRILKFADIYNTYKNSPDYEVIYDEYPTDRHHGWKYIAFGPEGKLYVPVGAPCNICAPEEIYASITRMDPDGSNMEIFAHGIRNTVGFAWHPETENLWFTDNGRDKMGDNRPPDELNKITEKGMHFGYPYCHGKNISDPKYGDRKDCDQFTPPQKELGPHVAALGMIFYTGDMFPEEYRNQILLAEHGSWNRSEKIGYRLQLVTLENNEAKKYKTFAKGWLQGDDVWGRPVDIKQLPDGSILVSDDYANAIYRITYNED